MFLISKYIAYTRALIGCSIEKVLTNITPNFFALSETAMVVPSRVMSETLEISVEGSGILPLSIDLSMPFVICKRELLVLCISLYTH